MPIFEYGEKELEYLSKKDKKLGAAIIEIGKIERNIKPDIFEAIVDCIVAQQISGKVAEKIYARVEDLCDVISPDSVLSRTDEELQACGLSYRKVMYIKSAARAVQDGVVDAEKLNKMSDDEVIAALSSLYGLGKWSAEMLMIFSLARKDVLSIGDFGIKMGMKKLYGHKEITPELAQKYKKRYSPYGTIASFYLWEIASRK